MTLKKYYGKRACNCDPKLDLGVKYFSSSQDKIFMIDQKNNPCDYMYTVVGNFITSDLAVRYEIYLHNKYNVGVNPLFYNKSKQTANNFDQTGVKRSIKTYQLRALAEIEINNDPVRSARRSKKISRANSGERNGSARAVYQIDLVTKKTIKKWAYMKLASESLRIPRNGIAACVRKEQHSCGGFGWKYVSGNTNRHRISSSQREGGSPAAKRIYQMDIKTKKIIKEWDCAVTASKSLKICKVSIRTCARGKIKTSGGFGWKYVK